MFGYPFYRQHEYKMVTHARVFSLTPKFNLNENQGLFISTAFHFLHKKFGYENMCSWEKIKNESILLPIKGNEINFDFMDSFMNKLKAEQLARLKAKHQEELKAYLSITGVKNYELTDEEQEIIKNYENLPFKDFSISSLFTTKNTGNIQANNITENSGKYPYLCASAENNAVNTYITYDKRYIDKGNCIFIGGKTFVVTYQEKDFFSNDSHNLIMRLKDETKRTKDIQLFIATCVKKSLSYKYSWGNSISNRKIKSDVISLPYLGQNPNYNLMPIFISAIKKLIIKDIVLHADQEINAAREVINKVQ